MHRSLRRPKALLDLLAARGVAVRVVNGQVQFRPRYAVDASLVAALREHRQEVATLLAGTPQQVPPASAATPLLPIHPCGSCNARLFWQRDLRSPWRCRECWPILFDLGTVAWGVAPESAIADATTQMSSKASCLAIFRELAAELDRAIVDRAADALPTTIPNQLDDLYARCDAALDTGDESAFATEVTILLGRLLQLAGWHADAPEVQKRPRHRVRVLAYELPGDRSCDGAPARDQALLLAALDYLCWRRLGGRTRWVLDVESALVERLALVGCKAVVEVAR